MRSDRSNTLVYDEGEEVVKRRAFITSWKQKAISGTEVVQESAGGDWITGTRMNE